VATAVVGRGVSWSIATVLGADPPSGRMTILLEFQTAALVAFGEITTDTAVLLATDPRTVPLPFVTAQLSGDPVQWALPPLI
jgi:hypothetical protein